MPPEKLPTVTFANLLLWLPAFCRTRRYHWEELADLHFFALIFCIVVCTMFSMLCTINGQYFTSSSQKNTKKNLWLSCICAVLTKNGCAKFCKQHQFIYAQGIIVDFDRFLYSCSNTSIILLTEKWPNFQQLLLSIAHTIRAAILRNKNTVKYLQV